MGGGEGWGKNKKKFMQGKMPRKNIQAKKKVRKKIHSEGRSNCDFYLINNYIIFVMLHGVDKPSTTPIGQDRKFRKLRVLL